MLQEEEKKTAEREVGRLQQQFAEHHSLFKHDVSVSEGTNALPVIN
jgi:hypothetical protein